MKKHLIIALLALGCLKANAQDDNWTWGGPVDPSQAAYDVKHYTLNLAVDPEGKSIAGWAEATVAIVSPIDHIKLDLIDRYKVSEVRVDGKKANFTRTKDGLDVQLKKKYEPGQRVKVKVNYAGVTPEAVRPPWQGGFTFSKDANGKHWVGLSSQNEGAKIFMPCKDHPSDEPEEGVDQHIAVPAPYKVAANGLLVSEKENKGQITYHWKTNYSINNYGINFTVGDFVQSKQNYTTINGNTVPMEMYLLRQNEAKLPELMAVLENSVKTQEKYFGEYPFWKEKIGIVETPYLGMEHQTINAYGNNYKYTKVGDTTHDWLLYHELGHEWWGNKVSVKDWADFWIQEGLCTYGDWLFVEAHGGHEAYLNHVKQIGRGIRNQKPIIVKEYATSDEAYHGEIYSKGAYIMHTVRYILGDDTFFKTIKGFISDPAYTYGNQVKTFDLQNYINTNTNHNITPVFDMYLRTTKVPEVLVKQTGDETYTIQVSNINFALPMEVKTDKGTQRMQLSSEPVTVTTKQAPVVDENGWYLKKVTTEKKTS
ncbi:M1 family metallopeptidase [uncultured Pontibacter sp.]|uniref:M1 family metallopeptidase n=1 Tax=uncultured Pontibacter sp. TaxID=453356 RepID=UPI002613D67C|nr:M1 family metallopeptidase [uncultured Pontibacter sp.]